MVSTEDYKKWNVYYTNRFRDKAFEGDLDERPDQTAEIIQLERRIKEREVEVRNIRMELHQAEKAFRTVQREAEVNRRKKELGIPSHIDALLRDVYERGMQSSKLRGDNLTRRSSLPHDWANVRNYVNNGSYGSKYGDKEPRKWNPVFVAYHLVMSAGAVLYNDLTKKGVPLRDRVGKARAGQWEEYKNNNMPFLD